MPTAEAPISIPIMPSVVYLCYDRSSPEGPSKTPLHSDAVLKAMAVKDRAFKQLFASSTWQRLYQPAEQVMSPTTIESMMRDEAQKHGLDFDAMLEAASERFTSPTVHRVEGNLSDDELKAIFEDDQRELGL